MNLELAEEYGAGFEGTKELLYKYLKDTPGQKIVKYMNDKKEIEEGMTADAASKVTAAQIEKYIDSQNFKALEQLTKFLSADEYELWSKNGFEGRTYELLMKQRAKNMKEAVEKIACLKCDAVSTAAAWQKNKGFCPVCKTSSQGVAESNELEEGMKELYAVVDENGVVLATASNELGAKRSISSSELPPLSVKDKNKLRIVKTQKQAEVGDTLKEECDTPSLAEARLMKIVSLATGHTDSNSLLSYVRTSPSYTSLVELKENFNKYIQTL